MRVGIFGGSLNPPHMGHVQSLQTVLKKSGLGEIRVIPAHQNPLKVPIEGPSADQRLKMAELAIQGFGPSFKVDDQEIRRGGKSYTIDTIKNLRQTISADDLYLIIGMDKLEELESWKNIGDILKETNLIITSRPGFRFPESVDDLPTFIKREVLEFDFNFIELKTGRNIQFVKIEDIAVSSTELRKWIRMGKNISKYVPLSVEAYIKENNLYKSQGDRVKSYADFTKTCADNLFSKKAISVRGYDLRDMSAPSEFTLVASGTSTRHASSLGENLMKAVKEQFNLYPQNVEGIDEGRWVVIDYGSLIVHIFYDYVRQEYSIENLWAQAKDMGFTDPDLKKS
jgi:nicotinate-nucleotide adenylyltransferase